MNKVEIRQNIIKKRNEIGLKDKLIRDDMIKDKLLNSDFYKQSNNIFIYVSCGSEVDTKSIIKIAMKEGKRIFVPRIIKETKEMKAIEIESLYELERNTYGILEPKNSSNVIDKNEIDIIIVPGIAFDYVGNRIGYGGGYYDRYLNEIALKRNKIALVYDFQLIDRLESEQHDVSVDYIITDKFTKYI